jgi:hypothetical protein
VPCIVHGELLVDEQTMEIDGWGWRSHRWGPPSPGDRSTTRGRTADGVWFNDPHEYRAATMHVVGAAPAPAPELGVRMEQFFATNNNGDMAWIRRVRPILRDDAN